MENAGSVWMTYAEWGLKKNNSLESIEDSFIYHDDVHDFMLESNLFAPDVKSVVIIKDSQPNLHLNDLIEKGFKDLFIQDGFEQVLVQGTTEDKITLSDLLKDGTDLGDWKQEAGTVTIAGEQYNVYQHSGSDVEVLVQMGVQVELQNH